MRVTVIPTITAYPWGAPGHCMGALVDELIKAGHEVQWFVAPIDSGNPEVIDLKTRCAKFHLLPAQEPKYSRLGSLGRKVFAGARGSRTIAEEVDAFSPGHVFVNQGGMFCSLQHDFAEVLRKRPQAYSLICHLNHEGPALSVETVDAARRLFGNAKHVYVNSGYMLDLAKRQIASDLPNARRYDLPHRFQFESPLPWPGDQGIRIAFVGRLDAFHKGLDVAVCALKEMKDEGKQFRFTLYGDGPDREYLDRLVRYLELENEVVFAGYADNVMKVWEQNEVLFMPSRHEGCAVAMTEAIGFGRPVIATAVGGASEWIENGATGFLAAAPTKDLVAEALRRAITARQRWPQMGKAAHSKFKTKMPEFPAKVFLEALRSGD